MRDLNPQRQDAIDATVRESGRAESDLAFLAARAPNRDFAVIVDRSTGAIVDRMLATLW